MSRDKIKHFGLTVSAKEKLIQAALNKRHVRNDVQEIETASIRRPPKKDKIPETWFRFDRFADYQQIGIQKAAGRELGIANPFFHVHEGVASNTSIIGGLEYSNFSSYNYLNLNGHPEVSEAAKAAIDRYGTSVSASRLVSGERPIHRELEKDLADFHGQEGCVAFVSGHATNVTTIGYLFGSKDLIIYDALSHNSIVQGALLSGAQRRIFPHNDWQFVDDFLNVHRMEYERVLIVIEGLYSMDGDYPQLPEFIALKQRHKAFLMVDEAHSLGVLGPKGNGIAAHFDVDPRSIDIGMGTLSKTLASAGGYIVGSAALVEMLRSYAPGFLYSVGIAPPLAAAAHAALQVLRREPERIVQLHVNGQLFLRLAKAKSINTGLSMGYSVIPVIVGSSIKAGRLSEALWLRGINVQPIFYPAVEEKAARLRFFVGSAHTEAQITQTVEILAEELAKST
ncbi:MAG: aminotransferase class I/II-fold pyridoxal phosphate-dependent enzyme [Gammaproteobacteria bacterium]